MMSDLPTLRNREVAAPSTGRPGPSVLAANPATVQPLPQGPHHLPVPQAINEGIEHRGENCVEDGDHLVMAWGPVASRSQVDEHGCPVEEGDGCQVGGTGGQSLSTGLSRAHVEYSPQNARIGGHDDGERKEEHEDTASKEQCVKKRCVFTGQFQ